MIKVSLTRKRTTACSFRIFLSSLLKIHDVVCASTICSLYVVLSRKRKQKKKKKRKKQHYSYMFVSKSTSNLSFSLRIGEKLAVIVNSKYVEGNNFIFIAT